MAISTIDEAGLGIQAYGNRNLIINGAMTVNQRGTKTGLNTSTETYGGPDRFNFYSSTTSNSAVFTASQQDTSKAEFPRSYRAKCTTAASAAMTTNQEIKITTNLEANTLLGLQYGYSTAKSITLSFWVRSNVTGTAAVWLYREDSTRQNGKTYTIDAADTWEHKTLTFNGDTGSGDTIPDDNGNGMAISWILATGPSYTSGASPDGTWEDITNANRYVGHTLDIGQDVNDYLDLTGVQLEIGETATPFEHRSYGDELARCQRYFFRKSYADGDRFLGQGRWESTLVSATVNFPVTMRANPSCTITNTGMQAVNPTIAWYNINSLNSIHKNSKINFEAFFQAASGGDNKGTSTIAFNSAGGVVNVDAEL